MSRLGLLVAGTFLPLCIASGRSGLNHICILSFNITLRNSGAIYFFGLFIVGFGLLVVGIGVHSYRTLRLLKNTPMTPIGRLTTGLVHIYGKAVGEELLTSPITGLACLYYAVTIQVWTGRRGQLWATSLIDTRHVSFHLQDATGRVAINLHQAELDLFTTFKAETGPRASQKRTVDPSLGGANGPSDGELLDYLSRANVRIHEEQAAHGEAWIRAAMNDNSRTLMPAVVPPEAGGRRLRFVEQCLLPDREYNILGTCVENPNPMGEQDRKLIARGGGTRHFVISCRPERSLETRTMWTTFALFAAGIVVIAGGIIFLVYIR